MTVHGHVEKGEAFHYEGKYYEDEWIRGFLRDYFLRPSCHECRFTDIKRVSDFTIADWWGYKPLKGESRDYEHKGVSLILCNTDKATGYFYKYSSEMMVLRERTIAEAMKTNKSLREPFGVSPLWNAFWQDYKTMTFDELAKKYMKCERLPLSLLLRSNYRTSFWRNFCLFLAKAYEKVLKMLNIKIPRF